MDNTPYEYYAGKLGVRIAYLISNKNPHADSLKLISYRTLKHRMDSQTCKEQQLRERSWYSTALVTWESICREWQLALIEKFGDAPDNIRQNYFAQQYVYDLNAYRYYSTEYTEGPERRRLTADKVDEYTFNASVLNTVREVKNNRRSFRQLLNSSCADIWVTLSIEVNNFNECAHTLPISPDGLRKKFAKYDQAWSKDLTRKSAYQALIHQHQPEKHSRPPSGC